MRLADCLKKLFLFALAARQSELMLPMLYFFMFPGVSVLNTRVTEFACSCFCPRVAVDQLSCENRADTIL